MKDLIDKYLNDSINNLELERLKTWIIKEKNQKKFKHILENHYQINLSLQEVSLDKEYLLLLEKIKNKNKIPRTLYSAWYKRAAIFIGLLGLGYIIHMSTKNSDKINFNKNTITVNQDNGNTVMIKEDGSLNILDDKGIVIGKQKGNQLDYKNIANTDSTNLQNESLVYNELVVPYGKKMKLILSDSSVVHVNSGTRLKYPVKFLKNQTRRVFLEGEAFFEVSKNKKNPFVVNTDKINVRVLGTKFDISSYPNDIKVNTVLVEGSVEVSKSNKNVDDKETYLLIPGQIASWNKSVNNMKIAKANTHEYTSWVNGEIVFKTRPFEEILKVLERHYNVSITNNYEALNNQHFFAKFDTETIEQVLIYFQNSIPFKYKKIDNKIEINHP